MIASVSGNTLVVGIVVGLAGSATRAGAGSFSNGTGLNGMNMQGILLNGLQLNGASLNGPGAQGVALNGENLNGASAQGTAVTGLRRRAGAAWLAVKAVVLPSGETVDLY